MDFAYLKRPSSTTATILKHLKHIYNHWYRLESCVLALFNLLNTSYGLNTATEPPDWNLWDCYLESLWTVLLVPGSPQNCRDGPCWHQDKMRRMLSTHAETRGLWGDVYAEKWNSWCTFNYYYGPDSITQWLNAMTRRNVWLRTRTEMVETVIKPCRSVNASMTYALVL